MKVCRDEEVRELEKGKGSFTRNNWSINSETYRVFKRFREETVNESRMMCVFLDVDTDKKTVRAISAREGGGSGTDHGLRFIVERYRERGKRYIGFLGQVIGEFLGKAAGKRRQADVRFRGAPLPYERLITLCYSLARHYEEATLPELFACIAQADAALYRKIEQCYRHLLVIDNLFRLYSKYCVQLLYYHSVGKVEPDYLNAGERIYSEIIGSGMSITGILDDFFAKEQVVQGR